MSKLKDEIKKLRDKILTMRVERKYLLFDVEATNREKKALIIRIIELEK